MRHFHSLICRRLPSARTLALISLFLGAGFALEALKGLGATVRLVMLPHESHGYRARESVLHVMWETKRWMDRYVKDASSGTEDNAGE